MQQIYRSSTYEEAMNRSKATFTKTYITIIKTSKAKIDDEYYRHPRKGKKNEAVIFRLITRHYKLSTH